MDSDLHAQTILITGASGGIGAATARAFAAEGARLVLHYHRGEDRAVALAEALPTTALAIGADLRDEHAVHALYARAVLELGGIDGLVVNAGVWPEAPMPLHEMTLERWQETLDANLTSAFLTCRGFLHHIREQPREAASIVVVGSTAAIFGEADHADYAAAKAGLVYGLTRSLKNEIVRVAPRGRVNAVCPGWTDTPMARSGTSDPEAMQRVFATAALRKIATPEDVARTIVFLSSATLAGHVTGAIVPVAGGMEGRLLTAP